MTKEQALKQATRRWGKKAFVRMNPSVSSPERRAAAKEKLDAARAEKEAIEKELNERLAACDWFQDLTQRKREATKRIDAARGEALYQRFAVGEMNTLFAHVKGTGDTFEEAFAEADK